MVKKNKQPPPPPVPESTLLANKIVEALQTEHEIIAREAVRAQPKDKMVELAVTPHQNTGWTPLHACAFHGPDYILEEIVACGVDVNVKLKINVQYTRKGSSKSRTLNCDSTPLHALVSGNLGQTKISQAISVLVNNGADIDAKDYMGYSPLFLAAGRGLAKVVDCLITKGSQINLTDRRGWTAMHFASHGCHGNVIEVLLEKGADPNCMDLYTKEVPLHRVVRPFYDNNDVIKAINTLLNHGCDVNFENSNEETALFFASQWTSPKAVEVIDLLVGKGAKVNQKSIKGDTPLHFAAKADVAANVQKLLDLGADGRVKNGNREYPYDLAKKDEVKRLLPVPTPPPEPVAPPPATLQPQPTPQASKAATPQPSKAATPSPSNASNPELPKGTTPSVPETPAPEMKQETPVPPSDAKSETASIKQPEAAPQTAEEQPPQPPDAAQEGGENAGTDETAEKSEKKAKKEKKSKKKNKKDKDKDADGAAEDAGEQGDAAPEAEEVQV